MSTIHEIFYNTITRQSDGAVVLNPRDLFNALKTAYDKGFSAGLSAKSETPAKKDPAPEPTDKPADTKPEESPNITWPWQTIPSPYTIPNQPYQPFTPLPGNPIPTAPGTAPWDRIWYTQYPSITCHTESVPNQITYSVNTTNPGNITATCTFSDPTMESLRKQYTTSVTPGMPEPGTQPS